MNRIRHQLLKEDRAEYERILDEALLAVFQTRPSGAGRPLTLEALRSVALNAAPVITPAAEAEYLRYVLVRGRHESSTRRAPSAIRRPAEGPPGPGRRLRAAVLGTGGRGDLRTDAGVPPKRWASMSFGRRLAAALIGLRVRPDAPVARAGAARAPTAAEGISASSAGGSVLGALSVLAPVLFGVSAVVFLLIGFALRVISPTPEFVGRLLVAGWAFGALSVVAVVIAVCGLLIRGLRVGAASAGGPADDVARAREAWRRALLERGILPFLREVMDDPDGGSAGFVPLPQQARTVRTPRIGYSRPNFTSPDFSGLDDLPAAGSRPTPARPDLDPPNTGGPEPRS